MRNNEQRKNIAGRAGIRQNLEVKTRERKKVDTWGRTESQALTAWCDMVVMLVAPGAVLASFHPQPSGEVPAGTEGHIGYNPKI